MNILVTNDDGIASPGLHALAAALRRLGDVWVVAPDRERTAVGHALTLHKPLRINRLDKRVFSVNGTPSDCVNLAIKKVLRGMPALIVSGINRGVNLGDDVTYSGTVSAALEGTILGVPSIAVSQEARRNGQAFQFGVAAAYAVRVGRAVLRFGLPAETLLNVNVPDRPRASIAGVKVTCLSRRRFEDPIVEKVDPHGRKYYWIAGTRVSWERRKDADHEALRRGMVSVTPIHLDITHYGALEQIRQWEPMLRSGRMPRRGRPVRTSGGSRRSSILGVQSSPTKRSAAKP
ncbi:MAG: 5'/3'-nucleotidase SurE [Nitrospirae bacterium]|nr:5'/3'-nucleotidase SurE [Nitrospirota bacterium]